MLPGRKGDGGRGDTLTRAGNSVVHGSEKLVKREKRQVTSYTAITGCFIFVSRRTLCFFEEGP